VWGRGGGPNMYRVRTGHIGSGICFLIYDDGHDSAVINKLTYDNQN
jgi:hypothetical protein